jgi:hypothetical protein
VQKLIVILLLIVILGSLGSAWYHLIKGDKDDSNRMLKSLTLRVGLSVSLFVFLIIGYYLGWFQPNIR